MIERAEQVNEDVRMASGQQFSAPAIMDTGYAEDLEQLWTENDVERYEGLPLKMPPGPTLSEGVGTLLFWPPPAATTWATSSIEDDGTCALVYYANRRCADCGRMFVNDFRRPGDAPCARCQDCRQRHREAKATCTPELVLALVPTTKRIGRETLIKKAARELWIPMTVAGRMLDKLVDEGCLKKKRIWRSRWRWYDYIERNISGAA